MDILLTIALVVALALIYSRAKVKPSETGFPSHSPRAPPALPLIGHLLRIPRQHPFLVFTEWARTYGDVIPLNVFGRRLLVLNSIEAAQELFKKRSANYSERAPRQMAYLCGFRNALIFRMYDRDTRKERKMLHAELNQQSIAARRQLCEQEVIKFIRRLTEPSANIGHEGRLLSASVILMIAYGYQTKPDNDPTVSVSLKVMQYLEKVITPNLYLVDALPFLRFVPAWCPGARFQAEAKICRKLIHKMVTEPYYDCLKRISAEQTSPCLVSQNVDKCDQNAESDLLMWTAAQLFGAGSHTSTSTIEFFFLAMVLHPEVQSRLQEEVDRIVGGYRLPTLSDRAAMPYSDCVLKEVYRWRPVAPLVAHSCRIDDEYKGLNIKAGTVVMANVWAMAHNEDTYPDSHRFLPERFLSSEVQDPRDFVFGFGRRICPGIHLAEDVLWMMIVTAAATLNILPALGSDGNPDLPNGNFTSGAVIEPLPFKYRIEPRSNGTRDLLHAFE